MPCSCQVCIFIWLSAKALPERTCKAGTPKRSSFWSHLPCRCCHGAIQRVWPHNSQLLMVRWMMSSGCRPRVGNRGPQGHVNTLDSGMSVSTRALFIARAASWTSALLSSLPASHTRGVSPKGGYPPPLRLFVPSWNQTSSHHPSLRTLALLGGKWPQICPSGRVLR